LKLPFQEADMTRYVGCNADECFLAGTAGEVIPVVKLDGREIGDAKPGPITQRVREAFRRRVLVKGTRL
jgi:branched-chain amino acid aminotransferase